MRTIMVMSLVALAAAPAAAQSCRVTAGTGVAAELVRRCQQVSPATHPPCNAENPCGLIIGEIRRGCGMLGADAPRFCREYPR